MANNFWEKLPRPFTALAPMADVTDAAFRRVIATYSRPHGPDVFWTEFVSADGLELADERGRKILEQDLIFSEAERPIVAQFFTARPEMMERAARRARERGFDGIDINMGCPDRSVVKQGAGAALMKDPARARELIAAAKQGAGNLPVSVKTRIGFSKRDELETWLPALLSEAPAALTLHARTARELSKVPARWEHIARAVELRDELSSETLIIGNGDVRNLADARAKAKETHCDGTMFGRAIFGTPWLFSNSAEYENRDDVRVQEKILSIMLEHTKLFEELLPHKSFDVMKKHYKAYVSGWAGSSDTGRPRSGAKELRVKLMACTNAKEVERVVQSYLTRH